MPDRVVVAAAVEGITDEALLKRVCTYVGAQLDTVYGKTGKSGVLRSLRGYNNSARFRHWIVILDLDSDADCAPSALRQWLSDPSPLMCLRLAVRELEAWILSDPERVAEFLRVHAGRIPQNPSTLPDPKESLISLARLSRRSDIREDIVPRQGSGQRVGPAYASRIIEFLQDERSGWRPEVAETNSSSLRGCVSAVRRLISLPYPPAQQA
jgi:hypothetical protein